MRFFSLLTLKIKYILSLGVNSFPYEYKAQEQKRQMNLKRYGQSDQSISFKKHTKKQAKQNTLQMSKGQ